MGLEPKEHILFGRGLYLQAGVKYLSLGKEYVTECALFCDYTGNILSLESELGRLDEVLALQVYPEHNYST